MLDHVATCEMRMKAIDETMLDIIKWLDECRSVELEGSGEGGEKWMGVLLYCQSSLTSQKRVHVMTKRWVGMVQSMRKIHFHNKLQADPETIRWRNDGTSHEN